MAKARSYLLLAAKLGVAALAFGFILSRQSWSDLRAAVLHISPGALALAVCIHASGLVVGTVRWRALMRAYGAPPRSSFLAMLRTYWVGDFYNTYVPGAVGGDILRGVITRRAFGEGGAAGALAVVLIERCLGLAAVLILTALAALHALLAHGSASKDQRAGALAATVLPYCIVGALGVLTLVFAITHGRSFAAFAPRVVRPWIASLPRLAHLPSCFFGGLLSLLTQSIAVACGHVLLSSVSADVTLADSFLALPMATAAGFLPLSVAGIGPRDVALVTLYELLGVARAHATAAAIGYSAVTLLVAGFGGFIQLFAPLGAEQIAKSEADS
jgi:glycosyltransferase 2 family protein